MKKHKSRIVIFGISIITILVVMVFGSPKIQKDMKLGLDLQGGFEILYEISPLQEGQELPDMSAVAKSVSKRVDILGVNEPDISVEGDNRIRVQLAGVKDADQARRMISSTANLTFRDVNDKLLMDSTVLEEGASTVVFDEYGKPIVSLKLKDSAKFNEVTTTISKMGDGKNLMVAWLDFEEGVDSYEAQKLEEKPKYISAATVKEGISGTTAQISGDFTKEEANELKDLVNSGSLPVKMTEQYSNAVTADYGLNAFNATMLAGGIGVGLIMLFMILYYRLPGLISAITIATYVFVVFYIYNLMGGVFTLSGIAALVLGVGMAADSNILTFERIKDGLYSGRSVKSAFYEGSSKSFVTILDAQLTTFISAMILFLFGTGSVRGFATMLIVSTISTLFLIVFVAKYLLGMLINSGYLDDKRTWFGVKNKNIPDITKGQERFCFGIFKNFDFVKNCKFFIILSTSILIAGGASMAYHGIQGNGILNFGVDFTSGTKIVVQSDNTIVKDDLNKQLEELGVKVNSLKINGEKDNLATIFTKEAIETESMDGIKASLKETYKHDVNDNVVTPIIGQELIRNAIIISLLAWLGVLIYISARFKWDYAISGIVGLIHDVFVVLAFCAIFRLEVNTEIIAVLLTIIGYSINNSIVVFDRIRENVKKSSHEKITNEKYKMIVNESLQRTATRSILSTFTTVLPVIMLMFMGSNAIFTFCLALFIGLTDGAGTSLFVAAQLWYQIRIHAKVNHNKKKKKFKKEDIEEMIIPGMNDY